MNEFTTFRMNDFLGNAGIIGLLKILNQIDPWEEHYKINDYALEVETKFLLESDLTQAYFDTLINEYGEQCPYSKTLKKVQSLIKEANKNDKEFLKELKALKKDLESNRYKTGYEYAKEQTNISNDLYDLLKRLVSLNVDDEITKCLKEIDEILNISIIKETFFMKDIAYFIINRFWDSKSFLNRNNAKKDMKEVHKKEIEELLKQYLTAKPKKGNVCVECGEEMSSAMSQSSSFINDFSEDFARKNSNYWNFKPNCYFCPKCLFLYTLIPLGFTKLANDFLFINSNDSLTLLKQVNHIDIEFTEEDMKNYYCLYNQILQNLNQQNLRRISNIQVITRRGIEGQYQFNIINREILKLLSDSKHELEYLSKYSYIKDAEGYRNIYEEVLLHLLYNQELYRLLNELLRFGLKAGNEYIIYPCMQIYQIEERRKKMKNNYHFIAKAGNEYRKAMDINGKDDATANISYKMLNALKSQDSFQFLDIIIRLSNGLKKKVPTGLVDVLSDTDEFKRMGYAFLLGFRGGYYEKAEDKIEKTNLENEGGEQ